MISGERAEKAEQEALGQVKKAGQEVCRKAKGTEKRNVYSDGGREKKRNWFCSRFFLLAAFLCLFVNQTAKASGLFSVLFSAGIQAALLWAVGKWIRMGRKKEKVRRREEIFVDVGFAVMLCVQLLLFTQAGGYPEDCMMWMNCLSGFPALGEWIWNHWNIAGAAAIGCADLSVLLAARAANRQIHRKGCGDTGTFRVFFLLFVLLGISPWLLVPQPLFFVMPVVTGLMLYAGRKLGETDRGWEEIQEDTENGSLAECKGEPGKGSQRESRRGCLAGGAAVLLFLLCLAAAGLNRAGIRAVFEGKSPFQLLAYWFESLKNGLADGVFGWWFGPRLTPFTMNGWALRLQNTVYPGADRYGWYAGLVQGTWVLLLCMEAAVPVKKAGKETVVFLIAMLLLPLWEAAGGSMAATAVFLPWLAVRTLKMGSIDGRNSDFINW